jgi:hypothetical protein
MLNKKNNNFALHVADRSFNAIPLNMKGGNRKFKIHSTISANILTNMRKTIMGCTRIGRMTGSRYVLG